MSRRTLSWLAGLGLVLVTGCLDPVEPTDGGLADAGFDAGFDAGMPDAGSFCDHMEASASHLRAVLQNCPGSGDSNIYGFNRATCDAQASTQCTSGEQSSLITVASCDLTIQVCADASDRSRAVREVSDCASDAGTISNACITALGN